MKPESTALTAFFSTGVSDEELPHSEIRALAMIGAGLLRKHLGDVEAIKVLLVLSRPFDSHYFNATAKAMDMIGEAAAGDSLSDDDETLAFIEYAAQHGLPSEEMEDAIRAPFKIKREKLKNQRGVMSLPSVLNGTSERLSHIEVRALASIGAGLLKKYRGNAQEISKLLGAAVAIDRHDYDQTVKKLTDLCNEATTPEPIYDEAAYHAIFLREPKK
ncbi:hypothetical protein [Collimonas sp.]|jgi:hypothetical protein|uniref:hypothetical protein n=1 Tax=Collimonas sp. TaxID=1963772 RepID=UPI002B94547A|nr:hypothetical protein [Collimonas sp.]HWW06354.1 hypothetical protein [Collimonas sp.]